MSMRTTRTKFIPSIILCLTGACADSDPSVPGSAGTSITSVTVADSTGSPTDGSATDGDMITTDDETSAYPDGSGEPPIVCNPEDEHEPNNVEDDAKKLPNITDEDSAGAHIESILAGEGDVDWFAYMGSDVALAFVDPASGIDADMELRLCLFVECINGPTKPFTCTDSIYDETPDLTLPGCCNSGGSAFVAIDLYCEAGGDESAYVFMRVDQGHDDICVPYEITYHF